jgi:MFS family permease
MCCINPIGAYYQKRMNTTVLLCIGFAFVFGGVFIAAVIAQTWNTFFLFYAIVQPIGYGILFWTPIFCAWEWFDEKKGLATGIIVGGFALSPGLFGQLTTAMVNP